MSNIPAAVRADLELLTPDQVCDLLQVKKEWLYDAVQAGAVPHLRLGPRQLRFRPADIHAWIAEGCPWPRREPEPESATSAPVRRRPRRA